MPDPGLFDDDDALTRSATPGHDREPTTPDASESPTMSEQEPAPKHSTQKFKVWESKELATVYRSLREGEAEGAPTTITTKSKPVKKYEPHPFAEIFPLGPTEGPAWEVFKASVCHRQCESIVLYDGKILDGRRRYLACIQGGKEPRVSPCHLSHRDALHTARDKNIHRLTDGQIAEFESAYEKLVESIGTALLSKSDRRGKKPAPSDAARAFLDLAEQSRAGAAAQPTPRPDAKPLPLDAIRIDGNTQPREAVDTDTVAEYAQRMLAGDAFPPLEVYFDG
jgi:hypothetical protein